MGLMRLRGLLLVLVGLVVLGLPAGAAAVEEGCTNEAVRAAESAAHPQGFASALPDCRAYEQVTPVDKDGTNPTGDPNQVQASLSGDAILFMVLANMPGGSGADNPPFFLGSRGGEGWSDRGLQAPRGPHGVSNVIGWSEDLSKTALSASEVTSGSGEGMYLRDSATGSFQLAFPSPEKFPVFYIVGFSADGSRVFFESPTQLLPSAAAGHGNLYELHGGVVSLVGVLPDGSTPPGGSSAGPSGGFSGAAAEAFYLGSAVSRDGSRVFFTARGTEQLYVREDGTRTVAVGTGVFLGATPDGSRVFYLAGGHLVEFNVESEQTTDLTPGGEAEGLLGMSDDGSYVYFAANDGGLYVWHGGTVSFIATTPSDPDNWLTRYNESAFTGHRAKASRATPDGRFLLFRSAEQLDRYDAVNGRLECVSCALGGAPPVGLATLSSIDAGFSGRRLEPQILLRNLSRDGGRVFFETSDALVPRDTNGVQDVYEWEQQGVGSCQGSSETFSASSGGCLYLISSGTSAQPSFFADASADGSDVFFFTFQPLVGQDQDGLVDVYDARVGGGLVAQNQPAPAAACEGEGCMPVAGGAPVFGAPVSASFAGAGNQTPPAAVVTAPKPKPKAKAKHKAKHKVLRRKGRKRRGARKAAQGGRGAGVRRAMRGGK
jgi:hypothetical protein